MTEIDEQESTEETPPSPDKENITFQIKPANFYGILVLVAFVLGIGLGYLAWGNAPQEPVQVATVVVVVTATTASGSEKAILPSEPTPTPKPITRYEIPINDFDPARGPQDAPITLIEYSDFECPYCRSFFSTTLPLLLETYPDQIRYIYKNFPLDNIHDNARPAAEAALCANEQDAFWEFHDLLFIMELELSPETYLKYATELGLDLDAFTACLEDNSYSELMDEDMEYATDLGIRSTPTFFINGIALVGAQPFELFAQVIDGELAGGFVP